ncbi:tumor necrosis factor receptor superfamily member 6 [Periophthalmus magnuspinnatus]|uniref:tumor necrosis factor receptor superfamily member 6 n=1 Tax=Periophthalmus magnuspinnatus TaxID=409849 RepID=UPI002436B174|nr:tumor necrosis factor receptor superfamily member 6 [Periophthalmus magnuspinnatus]
MDCSVFTLSLLCLLPLVDLIASLECSSTQYAWPSGNPQFCCDKCKPGTYIKSRDKTTCTIDCRPCTGNLYTDTYNAKECKNCGDCDKENMEEVVSCRSTHAIECRCKAGFNCGDDECSYCTETPATAAPSTATRGTTAASTNSTQDTVWFMIIICLLCLGIALVILTKMKTLLLRLVNSKSVKFKIQEEEGEEEKEEEPSTPVQEVCGKCDQLIDV